MNEPIVYTAACGCRFEFTADNVYTEAFCTPCTAHNPDDVQIARTKLLREAEAYRDAHQPKIVP